MSASDVEDSTSKHLTHVARGGLVGLAGAVVSAVSGFGLVLVVTNTVPADDAGTFFAATSVIVLLAAVASLGTEAGMARFALRYEVLGRAADIPAMLKVAFRSSLSLSIALALLLFVLAGRVAEALGIEDHQGANVLRMLALVLPFVSLSSLSLAGTRAFGRMRTTAGVDGIGRSGAQPVAAAAVGVAEAGSIALALSWGLPYVATGTLALFLLLRFLRRRGTLSATTPRTPYAEVRREFWAFTWPRSITRVSQMAIQRVDIILVAAMLSPRDAALYTAATRFVALGQVTTQAIQQVLQPKFTQLLAEEDHAVLGDIYRISAAWAMAVAWPLYVVIGCSPAVYLGLFGPGYAEDAQLVVVLMSVSMMLAVASGSADTLLLMSGRSGLSLVNSLVALTIDVVLCLVLIPVWGITGAAAAWGLAVLTKCLLAFLQARRYLDVISFGGSAAVVAAAALACLALPLTLLSQLADPGRALTAAVAIACLAAYAVALWLGRRVLRLSVFGNLLSRRVRKQKPAMGPATQQSTGGTSR